MANQPCAQVDLDELPDGALVTVQEIADWTRVTTNTVWRWARVGRIPQPLKIGPNTSRWRIGDIRAALKLVA